MAGFGSGPLITITTLILTTCGVRQTSAQVSGPLDYRVGEANNRLGSGGFNRPVVDPYAFNSANLFVTGNVAGGRSFRAFSPIRSQYSLSTDSSTLGVTTSVLDDFRRDSIGLDDVLTGRNSAAISPYFSRTQTATSLGTIAAGFDNAGLQSPAGFYNVPTPTRRLSTGRFGEPYTPELDWAQVNTSSPGRVGESPPASPFLMPMVSTRAPASTQTLPYDPTAPRLAPPASTTTLPLTARDPLLPAEVLQAYLPAELTEDDRLLSDHESMLSNREILTRRRPWQETRTAEDLLSQAQHRDRPPEVSTAPLQPAATALRDEPEPSPPTEFDPGDAATTADPDLARLMPKGQDILEDMLHAYVYALEQQDYAASSREQAGIRPTLDNQYQQALTAIQGMLDATLETFAGTGDDPVQRFIREAEGRLRNGRYYEARALYRRARDLDRRNPLLYLGEGHALLAAGEYYSAAQKLSRAIELFPGIAFFKLDLGKFIVEHDLLEKRRADLERRLDRGEDYRYRFLLGYAEYYTGLESYGLENLQRAAEQAPPTSGIAELPGLLTLEIPDLPKKHD